MISEISLTGTTNKPNVTVDDGLLYLELEYRKVAVPFYSTHSAEQTHFHRFKINTYIFFPFSRLLRHAGDTEDVFST